MVARLVSDISLTAFHALRTTGRTEDGINLLHEALLPLGPQMSRAVSEDSYSLAVSGCFHVASKVEDEEASIISSRKKGKGKGKGNSPMTMVSKNKQSYTVDEESLGYLTSLALQDNSSQSIKLRERLLQVLLAYGQYTRVKSSFESMLSVRVPVLESGAEAGFGEAQDSNISNSSTPLLVPLVLGTRAFMALISAHAALKAPTGVLSALELLLAEKQRAEAMPQSVKESLGIYTLSGPSSEEQQGSLPSGKVKGGLEVGAEKFVYIAAMDTSRQSTSHEDSQSKGRGQNGGMSASFYDTLTAEGGSAGGEGSSANGSKRDGGKRPLANPRRLYQVDMARGLMDRLGRDGVQVDTRFLLQVAELGCDDGDFDLCVKAIEAAHMLCQRGLNLRRAISATPFPDTGRGCERERERKRKRKRRGGRGGLGIHGGTSSVSTTQTSRGSISCPLALGFPSTPSWASLLPSYCLTMQAAYAAAELLLVVVVVVVRRASEANLPPPLGPPMWS